MGMCVLAPTVGRMAMRMMVVMMMDVVAMIRHGGATLARRLSRATKRRLEGASLHPHQSESNRYDQGITDALNRVDGRIHSGCGQIERRRGNAYDCNGDDGLQQRRCEGQGDAAPPRLAVRDQVGRDHRLSVSRSGRMENSI